MVHVVPQCGPCRSGEHDKCKGDVMPEPGVIGGTICQCQCQRAKREAWLVAHPACKNATLTARVADTEAKFESCNRARRAAEEKVAELETQRDQLVELGQAILEARHKVLKYGFSAGKCMEAQLELSDAYTVLGTYLKANNLQPEPNAKGDSQSPDQ